jgi:hypothetical protein
MGGKCEKNDVLVSAKIEFVRADFHNRCKSQLNCETCLTSGVS